MRCAWWAWHLLLLVRRGAAISTFPRRSNDDAALLEWGHSADIHAADAVIASFGQQAEQEEFVLGIEASPVVAAPIQGCERSTA